MVRIVRPPRDMANVPADPVLIHFYRAAVAHMDVWRQRMDATTNWAAATAAGMITFTFSTASAPHHVLLLALLFQLVFLLMESRRYQTFDLWRRRFRTLNHAFVVPALDPAVDPATRSQELADVARDLGRTVPHLGLAHATGYRLRRNYGYLLGLTTFAWLMKLELHPEQARDVGVLVERARVAFIPGQFIIAAIALVIILLVVLAARSPTGHILDWEAVPPRWGPWPPGRSRRQRSPDEPPAS